MRQLWLSYLLCSFVCITFNACSYEQSALHCFWYFTLTGQFSHCILRGNAFHAPNSSFQAFWRIVLVSFCAVVSESRFATAIKFAAVLMTMTIRFLRLVLRSRSSCELLWYGVVWRRCPARPISDVFERDARAEVCCALWTGPSCSTVVNSSPLDALTPPFVFMSLI